ncbi:MAG: acyl-CoA dehydrogenase family protein [Ketobacter sp.]|nr:acyl-CoA dehydrogenase family protein [Ketobacter sp.]
MDFTFSDDQRVLCDNVKQFLHKEISADQIRSGWDTDTGRDPGLWQKMVELGLTAMLVPESYGGLGMN